MIRTASAVVTSLLLSLVAIGQCNAQTLETETAYLQQIGQWKAGSACEIQASSEGTEMAVPVAIEYGVTSQLELLLEPVAYTAIRPKAGRHATGAGDFETTLTYRFRQESQSFPALALAGEVKLTMARDALIGTGRTDYAGYLIASKTFGRLEVHANLAYTVVGQPTGISLENIYSCAVAGIYRANSRYQLFAEVLGNTSSTASSEGPDTPSTGTVAPEAAGGELVGMAGVGRQIGRSLLVYGSLSYDNNQAAQLRVGQTFEF
jgi:hypothetical protein